MAGRSPGGSPESFNQPNNPDPRSMLTESHFYLFPPTEGRGFWLPRNPTGAGTCFKAINQFTEHLLLRRTEYGGRSNLRECLNASLNATGTKYGSYLPVCHTCTEYGLLLRTPPHAASSGMPALQGWWLHAGGAVMEARRRLVAHIRPAFDGVSVPRT